MNNQNEQTVQNTTGGLGTLQVNTFLADIGQPAEGAVVRVYDPDSGELINESVSNAEGLTPPIELVAPPFENSMSPDMPRPFNQYNVTVQFPDYQDASIQNVQIYPSTAAIQNVFMTPRFESIYIPYPVLWGDFPPKIPESEIKRLPSLSYLVVLPQPVVPSIIIVHDGLPEDSSAPNYTVSFTDYIKNVASSEIYSSWPREALRANITAIQSFTMNRVFTEWYRSRGYDFTITSSTAYDQSFNYGRNIFREVSEIVDENFTTYVARGNIVQPLLTQYSDGIQVVREGWLSQWGSKSLADQGFTHLQILRHYYGYDISLRQAERVEGIPLSFQGTLSMGSRGDAVRTIQNQLNAISNNFPLIPKLVEDGIFGERTAESVRTFQGIFNLPVTGRVDFATWYAISRIYVAVTRLA